MITAGQQVRAQITIEANLTNRDAVLGPQPYVKWSHEPPRAAGRPGRARARDPPSPRCRRAGRRSSRSRWTTGTPRPTWTAPGTRLGRLVTGRSVPDPDAARGSSPARLESARNPVLVAGPDIDASGGWDAASRSPSSQRLPVWATPAPGGGRIGFPENHPNFRRRPAAGDRPAVGDARRTTTSCSSSARRCSRTTRTSRARCSPRARR